MSKAALLKFLKAVLKKHNASIGFTCSECSDTYGIYDAGIEITMDNKQVLKTNYWGLGAGDL